MYDIPDSLSLTSEDALICEHLILLDTLNETADRTAEMASSFTENIERAIAKTPAS